MGDGVSHLFGLDLFGPDPKLIATPGIKYPERKDCWFSLSGGLFLIFIVPLSLGFGDFCFAVGGVRFVGLLFYIPPLVSLFSIFVPGKNLYRQVRCKKKKLGALGSLEI